MKLDIEKIKNGLKDTKGLKQIIEEYDKLDDTTKNHMLDDFFCGRLEKLELMGYDINLLIASSIYHADQPLLDCVINFCTINKYGDILDLVVEHVSNEFIDPLSDQITDKEELRRKIIRRNGMYPDRTKSRSITFEELTDIKKFGNSFYLKRVLRRIATSSYCNGYTEAFEKYKNSKVDYLRLYLCGYTNKPEDYLNDSNERVRKVATLRTTIDEKIKNRPENEQATIQILTSLFNKGKIECWDGLIPYKNGNYIDETVCAEFSGIVSSGFFALDNDIFSNIVDNRVLAETLVDYIKIGKVYFVSIPEEYVELFKTTGIEPLQLNYEELTEKVTRIIDYYVDNNNNRVEPEKAKQTAQGVVEHFKHRDWLTSIYFEKKESEFVAVIYDKEYNPQGTLSINPSGVVSINAINKKRAKNGGMADAMYNIIIDGNEIKGNIHDIIDLSTKDSYDSVSVVTRFNSDGIIIGDSVIPYKGTTSEQKLIQVEEIHKNALNESTASTQKPNVLIK